MKTHYLLPDIPNVPYLDVVAAESEDRKSFICVNRHQSPTVTAEIDSAALNIAPGTVTISTISGDIPEKNDAVNPINISPAMRKQALTKKLTNIFSNKSASVITTPCINAG